VESHPGGDLLVDSEGRLAGVLDGGYPPGHTPGSGSGRTSIAEAGPVSGPGASAQGVSRR
jgi:hypothetical protein